MEKSAKLRKLKLMNMAAILPKLAGMDMVDKDFPKYDDTYNTKIFARPASEE